MLLPDLALSQNGVTLLATLNQPHGSTPNCYGTVYYSSCWGWVSPDGKEYAFLGTYTGTAIIDLNVTPIREIAFIPGPAASCAYREIKTYKHYAYIVSEGGQGVQIVDLSGLPDTAVLVRSFNYVSGGKNTLRSHTVTLADGYLYLNGCANWSPGGIVIFSLRNDPTNPEYVGQFEPQYVHDSFVRNDTLYAAAIYSGGGLYVVNVQDKANPQIIRFIQYTGSGTHHAWASVNGGRYVFTTDEIGTTQSSMKVWDIQNLGSGPPYVPLASYQYSPADYIHNVHGRGNYAYISHYSAGVRVVNVHNPALPSEAGGYDTYPGASGSYNGCWGVYPYFPSGRWIGSDMQTGLYVFRFDSLKARTRSPLLSPPNNTVMSAGSNIFRWRRAASMVEDPHYYKLHVWGSGVDTLMNAPDTSLVVPALPGFQTGQVYNWHVWIGDEFTSVSSQDTFHFTYGSSVGVIEPSAPISFALLQNYPNPFNPSTLIAFQLPAADHVSLEVLNVLGEKVATLVDEIRTEGLHEVRFDASSFASGVYLYRLKTARGLVDIKKMILIR